MSEAPIRLAFRVEGDWWVAYLAKRSSMDNARELGRVLMGIVTGDDGGAADRKQAFMDLMKAAIAGATDQLWNVKPEFWDEQPAPEHERSGSA